MFGEILPAFSQRYRRAELVAFLCLLAFVVATCAWRGVDDRSRMAGILRVTFLDVGQGDSTVIEGPSGKVVIVDGGGVPGTDEREGRDPGSRVVVPFLRSRGISTVDLLVPTHPDDDHVQGLIAVNERLHVVAALNGGYPGDSKAYRNLLSSLSRRHVPTFLARRGQRIDLGGGARLEVLNPPDHAILGAHSATNPNSIVLRIVYGRARILLTGDADTEAEKEMIATVPDLSADILKAGHHGSRWSSTGPFLERVRPSVAVVSCGANNTYGHPHKETLERFAAIGARVFRTDRQGAITLETDGVHLHLRSVR